MDLRPPAIGGFYPVQKLFPMCRQHRLQGTDPPLSGSVHHNLAVRADNCLSDPVAIMLYSH
eukprot:10553843-Karenia_brevis.AAC.1